MFVDIIKVLIL